MTSTEDFATKHPRGANPANTGQFSEKTVEDPRGGLAALFLEDVYIPSYEEATDILDIPDAGDGDPLTVQPVGQAEHYWGADDVVNDGMSTSRMIAAAKGPYTSAVPPRLATAQLQIPADLATDIEEATTALARFDNYAMAKLGAGSPTLGPMSAVLLRTESTSSSQIENLTVGARQLALAELEDSPKENPKIVIGNVRAMEAALELADRLDEDAILHMQEVLIARQRGWEEHAGCYRKQLVWVGISNISPRGASHVAPQPDLVPEAMTDLIKFIRRDDIPVVAQVAIAHAQFETIHPFADGNGRTGRALVAGMFRAKGILSNTAAPISAGLLKDTDSYFKAISAYQQGDARPIVERFAAASRFAALSGMRLVDDLSRQLDESKARLDAAGVRSHASARKLVPSLIAQPIVNLNYLVENHGMSTATAQRALEQLTAAGVLEERTGFKRNRVWQHPGILQTLDHYAQQIMRK